MLATTCPSSMRSRRRMPPSRCASRWQNSRPASRLARPKIASRKIFLRGSETRPVSVTQTAETHQATWVWAYDFASGCAVAPSSTAAPTVTLEAFIKDKYIMWVGPFAGDNHGFTNSPAGIANSRYTLTAQNGQVFGLQNQTHFWGGTLGWAGTPVYGGTETQTAPGVYTVNMNIIARDPYGFGMAPAVSNGVNLTVNTNTGTVDGTVRYTLYPSLQVFVNGTPVFQHDQSIILGSLTMGTGQVHVTLPPPPPSSTPGPSHNP